jgi:16S rRNA (guanine(1405)-N(7))-methyltransferase
MSPAHVSEIVRELQLSKKYKSLSEETINRVVLWASQRQATPRDAVKAAKRKLHQIYAAYCHPGAIAELERRVAALPPSGDTIALKEACADILLGHASTAERIPFLSDVYAALWQVTGRPRVLLDYGCGFGPFALPWMELDPSTVYYPSDIDRRVIAGVNLFLAHMGRPTTARCVDLCSSVPEAEPIADCALLLKILPILEQQEKGISFRVINAIPSRLIVVSFPSESLGGFQKGMREHYHGLISSVASELGVSLAELHFSNESFYVMDRGDRHPRQSVET